MGTLIALLFFFGFNGSGEAVQEKNKAGYAAVGEFHSLVLDGSGALWVFGDNSLGQLGIGNLPGSSSPKLLMRNVKSITAGAFSSFAISTDGTLWGFGENSSGELGFANFADPDDSAGFPGSASAGGPHSCEPIQVLSRALSVSISPGNPAHALGLDESGDVWSWGDNSSGQLGNGSIGGPGSLTKILGRSSQVLAGTGFSLAVGREYSLWTWGKRQPGGSFSGGEDYKPRIALSQVLKAAAGDQHCLALRKDDTVWVWGRNSLGQVGDGSRELRFSPLKIMDNALDVAAGPNHSFVLDLNRQLWGWGSNHDNQLGLEGVNVQLVPAVILKEISQVYPSETYTLALDMHDRLWFMGRLVPPDFPEFEGFAATAPQVLAENVEFAAPGRGHILFIKTDGSLWGVGNNTSGQLGQPDLDFLANPVEINLNGTAPEFAQ